MKKLYIFTLVTLLSLSLNTLAHGDHGLPQEMNISQDQAIMIAKNEVTKQVKSKQISESWSPNDFSRVTMKRLNGRLVWEVSFTLPKDNNIDSKQMQVYVSKIGEFISLSD